MIQADTLKPGWQIWRFDQIVTNVNDRINDPSKAETEYYVGLEHLDSDSLKIRRWGSPSDVEATKLCFRKGDIIFGRRRVYQRKVAVADFDGICSAHALVLRAKPEVILPEFLPFFMQSDVFMERAKAISVGSLSPTINWKTLAKEKFLLPSKKDQQGFYKMLSAIEDTNEAIQFVQRCLENLIISKIENFIHNTKEQTILDQILTDISYGCSQKSNYEQQGVPILRIPNVLRGELDLEDLQWLNLSEQETNRYVVKNGDILLVRSNGNPDYVGRCVVVKDITKPLVFASYLIRLRVNSQLVLPEFVASVLNAPSIRRKFRGDVRSSAGNFNINTQGIKRQKIPLPTLEAQTNFVNYLKQIWYINKKIDSRINYIIAVKKSILDSLGGL